MGKKLVFIVVIIAVGMGIFSQISLATTFTRYPYLQCSSKDSIIITWKTDMPSESVVEYGLTPDLGFTVKHTTETTRHAVRITDLKPGTTYYYRAISGDAKSDVATFHTNKDTTEPSFAFLVFGDLESPPSEITEQIVSLVKDLTTDGAEFGVLTGDMIRPIGAPQEFDPKYFIPYRDVIKDIVLWPCIGNHDLYGDSATPYLEAFYTPCNNAENIGLYYSFNYGRSHFIVLDSEISGVTKNAPQYHWLKSDLMAASLSEDIDFIFVFFHRPAYTSFDRGPDMAIRENFCPLFEKYGVDVVFSGHDHNYERSIPIDGVSYIITASAGAELKIGMGNAWHIAYFEETFHVTKVDVDELTVKVEMIRNDGTVGDRAAVAAPKLIWPGTIRIEPSFNSATIIAPYAKDENSNGTAILEHKSFSEQSWVQDGPMERKDNHHVLSLSELSPDTPYDVRVTYKDPEGIVVDYADVGKEYQQITSFRTLPVITSVGPAYANFSPGGIEVIAEFDGDANDNGFARLEYKSSSETVWIDVGIMRKDNRNFIYTMLFPIEVRGVYDFRVTYADPDGVQSKMNQMGQEFSVTIKGCQNVLGIHRTPIIIDGKLDDWLGALPAEDNTWVLNGWVNEYIWRDALDDDLGAGSYIYPTGRQFSGTEGDIEEFRIARGSENLYFLINLAGSTHLPRIPFSIILIDCDGSVNGKRELGYNTKVLLGGDWAWDYRIIVVNGEVIIEDYLGNLISVNASVAQNLEDNFYELSIPIAALYHELKGCWRFALLQSLNIGTSQKVYQAIEVDSSASAVKGGGGMDNGTNPNIYDLIGTSGSGQSTDLSNYTASGYSEINNSYVKVCF